MPKLTRAVPRFPGDLIQRHQKALAKGKMPKESMATEKAELKMMKKAPKKMAAKKVAKSYKK